MMIGAVYVVPSHIVSYLRPTVLLGFVAVGTVGAAVLLGVAFAAFVRRRSRP